MFKILKINAILNGVSLWNLETTLSYMKCGKEGAINRKQTNAVTFVSAQKHSAD